MTNKTLYKIVVNEKIISQTEDFTTALNQFDNYQSNTCDKILLVKNDNQIMLSRINNKY